MIIKKERNEFLSYLEDTSNLVGKADILFLPETQEEVISVAQTCYKKKIPLTISGARTGTVGGCVPWGGGIISLERLRRIKDIDKDAKTAVVEAGVSLQELEKEVRKFSLSLICTPTEELASVGGAVSTSASGLRGVKYGKIRRYVKRLKIVLIDGTLLEIERGKIFASKRYFCFNVGKKRFKFQLPSYHIPSIKHQGGYFVEDNMDLIDLFIGSEGTLGIIVEVELSLYRLKMDENNIFDCVVFFRREDDALNFVQKIKSNFENINVSGLEYFDTNALNFLVPTYPQISGYKAAVYIEDDSEMRLEEKIDFWVSFMEKNNIDLDATWMADNKKEKEKIKEFRHKLPELINEFLKSHHQKKVAGDIAVPSDKFKEMYQYYKDEGEASGIFYVNFGHIGENHLHFNFLPRTEDQYVKAKEIMYRFCKKAINLGGTISAEHGIGKIKKEYFKLMFSKMHLRQMVELKRVFDSHFLLGRGNIFEENLLK